MPTTLAQLTTFLDEFKLSYDVNEEHQAIAISFTFPADTTSYRDRDGDAQLQLLVQVAENGELLIVVAPQAWSVELCPHEAAVFEVLVSLQSRFRLLRFNYDPSSGHVHPTVELPLDDSILSVEQFHRVICAVMIGVNRLDAVIRHALQTGEIRLELMDEEPADEEPTEEERSRTDEDFLRLESMARRAGGVEGLERLLGGADLDEETTPERQDT